MRLGLFQGIVANSTRRIIGCGELELSWGRQAGFEVTLTAAKLKLGAISIAAVPMKRNNLDR
jgi:hypothetical protein